MIHRSHDKCILQLLLWRLILDRAPIVIKWALITNYRSRLAVNFGRVWHVSAFTDNSAAGWSQWDSKRLIWCEYIRLVGCVLWIGRLLTLLINDFNLGSYSRPSLLLTRHYILLLLNTRIKPFLHPTNLRCFLSLSHNHHLWSDKCIRDHPVTTCIELLIVRSPLLIKYLEFTAMLSRWRDYWIRALGRSWKLARILLLVSYWLQLLGTKY